MKQPPMPIVVGVPRSGTTLLRLMLDAHPELAIPPETHFLQDLLDPAKSLEPESCAKVLTTSPRWADFGIPAETIERELAVLKPFSITTALRSFYRLYASRFGKSRYGDKTPLYCLRMRQIEAILPEAHFVHIVRDGRDVYLSHRAAWWSVEDPGDAADHARFWAHTIEQTIHLAQQCRHVMHIRYEDLVCEPEIVLRRICSFIELDYTDSMLQYHATAESRLQELQDLPTSATGIHGSRVDRRRIHSWTTRPPSQAHVGRWKSELSFADQLRYEFIAADTLGAFSYPVRWLDTHGND